MEVLNINSFTTVRLVGKVVTIIRTVTYFAISQTAAILTAEHPFTVI
jgi:hypothetical protein